MRSARGSTATEMRSSAMGSGGGGGRGTGRRSPRRRAAAEVVAAATGDEAHLSAVIGDTGLAFAKDVLIGEAVRSLTPLRLPGAEKAFRVPFLGGIRAAVSNITLFHLDVGDDSVVGLGDSALVVVASGITANISMAWSYSYYSWYFPVEISDRGTASILVID